MESAERRFLGEEDVHMGSLAHDTDRTRAGPLKLFLDPFVTDGSPRHDAN